MLFRDAKLTIQQAAMSDFLVRRIIDTRRYIERESGRPISDEDFYAALAVAMMQSRDHWQKGLMDHMNICPYVPPVLVPRDRIDPSILQIGGWRYKSDGERYWHHGVVNPFTEGGDRGRPLTPAQTLNPFVQQDERDRKAAEESE